MVDDDNRAESNLDSDAEDAGFSDRPTPRRSTFTSTSAPTTSVESQMSDDALAQALEEDFGRATHTSSLPVVDDSLGSSDTHEAESLPDRDHPEPQSEQPQNTRAERPVRRSVPTAELAATLAGRAELGDDPGQIIAQLEEQLQLREHDANEFMRWQQAMVADGGDAAIAEVEAAREVFHDIIDDAIPAAPAAPAPAPVNVSLDSHKFGVDGVLDSDLLNAPAPRSAPISDIPPPPGHVPGTISAPAMPPPPVNPTPITGPTDAAPAPPPEPPSIPDLVEPDEYEDSGPLDFDALIEGTVSAVAYEPRVFLTESAPMEPRTGDDVDGAPIDDRGDIDGVGELISGPVEPFPVTSEGVTVIPDALAAYSGASASAAAQTVGVPLIETATSAPPVFGIEESSVEPTLTQHRVGRASRLFWLWFAANSSIVSLAFGGAVFALGMSLRQAIVAILIGVSISFLPLGLGTLAGKWSGQPTMVVSRATFGHLGNIAPAALAIVVRVFWGAVLLWFLAAGTARILTEAELGGPFSETQITIIGLALGFLLALVIAFFGYGLIARIQLTFTIISALLIAALIIITWPAVNISTALTVGDGPWILVLTGAVLVFSFVGLVWAVSSADLARYQRPSGSGAASMLWSTFGATIPAFILIAYGAVLAASNPDVAAGLLATPLDTIALLMPIWYPIPLIAALIFSLLSGVVVSIYSGGFALQATGASMRRSAGVIVVGVAVAAVAVLIAVSVGDFTILLRDVATSLAVPIAAWAGIFGAEMMIRNKGFNSRALVNRGGAYPDVNWVNLSMLIVASAIGFGLTTAAVSWLSWQGYLFELMGVSPSSDFAASDLGVFVALVIGLLTPIVAGIPRIRQQEAQTSQPERAVSDPSLP